MFLTIIENNMNQQFSFSGQNYVNYPNILIYFLNSLIVCNKGNFTIKRHAFPNHCMTPACFSVGVNLFKLWIWLSPHIFLSGKLFRWAENIKLTFSGKNKPFPKLHWFADLSFRKRSLYNLFRSLVKYFFRSSCSI